MSIELHTTLEERLADLYTLILDYSYGWERDLGYRNGLMVAYCRMSGVSLDELQTRIAERIEWWG